MSLASGSRLGPYEIVSALGAGGMGEVYRARDTKLGRDVALKILPEMFASDPDRLARFDREARTLASLNHPHIAQIYGVEESGQVRALAMEFVDGDDLAQRLARGSIPIDEALPIARQIAEALEVAHEAGIIHRDLKPANVKVRPDGTVKVLDFGLAKALEPVGGTEVPRYEQAGHGTPNPGGNVAPNFSSAPPETITSPAAMTEAGSILGTAAYMAPEQARGKPVDRRADIWAFGCVLFEMLSGRRAFEGPTVSDLIAAVLTRDPDWSLLPATIPASVRQLLARCLDRDPTRRLRDIGEARFVLDNPAVFVATVAAADAVREPAPVWRRALPWGVAALMAGIAGVATWESRRPAPPPLTARFAITLPPDAAVAFEDLRDIPALVLSPDGSRLAYVARRNGIAQLYVRDLDRLDARLIPGTEDARGPFFSPDGSWIGFFTGGELKKVSLGGGAPQVICPTPPVPRGASWGPDDTIIFAPQQATGLVRVSAASRAEDTRADVAPAARAPTQLQPEGLPVVTSPDAGRGERAHLWPEVLPGGKAVLFTIATTGNFDDAVIAAQSLATGDRRILIKGGSNARYAPSGHLIYARARALLAVPFDLARLETTGPPATVVEGVRMDPRSGAAQFSLSASGSLVYVAGGLASRDRTLLWVDRRGGVTPLTETRRPYSYLSLSPDGRQLAFTMQGINQDVWIHDLDRAVQTRLTFGPAENWGAIWTPDNRRLIFSTHGPHMPNLFWMAADGSGTPERLTTREAAQYAGSVSPDGQLLAFTEEADRSADIWLLPLQGAREARRHIATPYHESGPTFSPDGRWLAYVSNESGRLEVYVQPFPGPGAKRQVSTAGGVAPVWGRGTRELFYRIGDRTLAVTFSTDAEFRPSTPRVLFEGVFEEHGVAHWSRNYDVTPAGDRFVMVKGSDEPPRVRIDVVLNWSAELQRTGRK